MPAEPLPDDRPPAREPGFLQVVLAVASSFFGVRKRRGHDALGPGVKPQHLVVAGVIGAALFVLVLLVVVRFVIAHAA
jgi:hypothetical protein